MLASVFRWVLCPKQAVQEPLSAEASAEPSSAAAVVEALVEASV
jgi:hypothetical protein